MLGVIYPYDNDNDSDNWFHGFSEEEAKKKIYACSTSNYTGFHVEVTEAESEKFNGSIIWHLSSFSFPY